MTPTGRLVVAVVAMIIGGALVVVGTFKGHDGDQAIVAGASTIALVAGYVFGDRNGEKRLANALTVLQATNGEPEPTAPSPEPERPAA